MNPPICIYCQNNESSTGDHVPPKCFIRRGFRESLVKVPACRECNNGFSKNEEYFRLLVVGLLCHTRESDELFDGAISRSMDRRKHIEDLMFDSFTPDTGRVALDWDHARIGRIIEKIWRGLEFAFMDTLHPKEHRIKWTFCEVESASLDARFAPDFSFDCTGDIREFTLFDSVRFYVKPAEPAASSNH